MHYKNGCEAKDGDQVIGRDFAGNVLVGRIHQIAPGYTCNAMVAPVIGEAVAITVNTFFRADDALACIEGEWAKSQAALAEAAQADAAAKSVAPPVSNSCVAEGCEQFAEPAKTQDQAA